MQLCTEGMKHVCLLVFDPFLKMQAFLSYQCSSLQGIPLISPFLQTAPETSIDRAYYVAMCCLCCPMLYYAARAVQCAMCIVATCCLCCAMLLGVMLVWCSVQCCVVLLVLCGTARCYACVVPRSMLCCAACAVRYCKVLCLCGAMCNVALCCLCCAGGGH